MHRARPSPNAHLMRCAGPRTLDLKELCPKMRNQPPAIDRSATGFRGNPARILRHGRPRSLPLLLLALGTLFVGGSAHSDAPGLGAPTELSMERDPSSPLAAHALLVVTDGLHQSDPARADEVRSALVDALRSHAIGVVASDDSHPGPDAAVPEGELLVRARERSADLLIVADLARLGTRASLELRVLPTSAEPESPSQSLLREVLPIDHPDQLESVLAEAAERAQQAVALWAASPATVEDSAQPTLAAPDPALAAIPKVPDTPGNKVFEVSVSGNRRIDADAIRAVAATRTGAPYDRASVSADIRRIFELGFFRDVQAMASETDQGVRVEFAVDEHPIIRRVTISGNENMDGDDLTERMTIAVGATIDYPLVLENQRRIQSMYQARGYYTAKVAYDVSALDEHSVTVNYDVDEGELLRLREIRFIGNENMADADLMEGFQTKPWGPMSFITRFWDNSGMYAEPIFYQDLEKAQRKYLDSGYIRARIGEPEVQFDERGLRVNVPVEEGPRFRVGEIQVQGDDSMDSQKLWSLVQMQPGDVFSRARLSDDVERLRLHYADLGFFQADVKPRTKVDPDTLTVECTFETSKGELFFVDRIQVDGNTRTRDDVVRRELSVVEGELFSAAALRRSRARLRRLGFFEEVTVESRATGDDRVAVDIGVVERPTGSFTFGAGFGSADGFLLNAALRQDNLFGRAYGVNLQADLGTRNQRASLNFTNPFFRGTSASFSTGLNFSSVDFEDFEQTVSSFSLGFGYPLDEGETRLGTSYSFSDQDIDSDFDRGVASLLQREEFGGRSTTSSITFSGSRDTRDDPRFTRSGNTTGFSLEVAGLGGVNKFLRLEARTTRYMPFQVFGLDSTFIFNTRAAYAFPLNSISDFDLDDCSNAQCLAALASDGSLRALSDIDDDLELPLSERFILGGVGSFQLRGYENRSVGPRRARLRPMRVAGGQTAFQAINRDPACNGPGRASLPDDACNDFDDSDPDDFEDLDLTDVIGGNKMFLANFEVRTPIAEDYGVTGILFFDMGNAFAEDESFNPADLRLGTGVGAEWLSPFGPIVVYLGIPLNRLEDEKASVFEFSLGGSSF